MTRPKSTGRRPAGRCPVCRLARRVYADGTIGYHVTRAHPAGCPGAGKAPVERWATR
jgi:hypothetical protein